MNVSIAPKKPIRDPISTQRGCEDSAEEYDDHMRTSHLYQLVLAREHVRIEHSLSRMMNAGDKHVDRRLL